MGQQNTWFQPKFFMGQHSCKIDVQTNKPYDLTTLFDEWLINTDDWTSESFCRFVQEQKIPDLKILSKAQLIAGVK